MKSRSWIVVLSLVAASPLLAAHIPYYRMDSLILLSDAVVFCDELAIQHSETKHPNWTEEKTSVQCKVIRVFKGEIHQSEILSIEYDMVFRRQLWSDYGQLALKGTLNNHFLGRATELKAIKGMAQTGYRDFSGIQLCDLFGRIWC